MYQREQMVTWRHSRGNDVFLETVKVIDLSHDRLRGTNKLSQKKIKLPLQMYIIFYLGRGLNILR